MSAAMRRTLAARRDASCAAFSCPAASLAMAARTGTNAPSRAFMVSRVSAYCTHALCLGLLHLGAGIGEAAHDEPVALLHGIEEQP